jgi:hypothetical protein
VAYKVRNFTVYRAVVDRLIGDEKFRMESDHGTFEVPADEFSSPSGPSRGPGPIGKVRRAHPAMPTTLSARHLRAPRGTASETDDLWLRGTSDRRAEQEWRPWQHGRSKSSHLRDTRAVTMFRVALPQ